MESEELQLLPVVSVVCLLSDLKDRRIREAMMGVLLHLSCASSKGGALLRFMARLLRMFEA